MPYPKQFANDAERVAYRKVYQANYRAENAERLRQYRARPDQLAKKREIGARWRAQNYIDLESDIVKHLIGLLDSVGWKHRLVAYRGIRGCPDILVGATIGRLILIETKRPKRGILSKHQIEDHESWAAVGVIVEVIWTKEQANEWFERTL